MLIAALAAATTAARASADDAQPALETASPAAVSEGSGAGIPTVDAERTQERRRHILGLAIDAGVPDFAAVSLLYRPISYVRLGAGMLYDYAGYGVRGSVSVLPYWFVAPSLTIEAGHFFETDATAKVDQLAHFSASAQPDLSHLSHTFASAQLGLEIGHPDWFVFFVRGGISQIWLDAPGTSHFSSDGTRLDVYDPSGRFRVPSAKLGLMFYFY